MTTTAATPIDQLQHVAGADCLDFANTVATHPAATDGERLRRYDDLIAWSRQAGTISEGWCDALLAEAERCPDDADAVRRRAIELRELIYRLFTGTAGGHPSPADLQAFNALLDDALRHARVVATADGFSWDWDDDPRALDRPLWPILRSVADLLVSSRLDRVRECAGDDCDWLFLDTSRNGTRRWCSMETCGNRAKVRRFYARHGH
ncbi:MAG TPA: CGNR zinc finger domain-containing protein [Thermomicrobiaceae bacterium]|nr:CGNR zinc finger domain-containing protein [Thermomicrobiaceae bacterium]